MKILLKTLGLIIIIATILMCLLSFVPKAIGWEAANVVSGSMEPSIPVGSLVMAAPQDCSSLQTGDVIMFMSGESYVTHRVVTNNTAEETVITKGDANEQEDMNPVMYSQIKGKVIFHIPFIGNILQILSTLEGKLYAIAAVVVGAILMALGSKKKNKEA